MTTPDKKTREQRGTCTDKINKFAGNSWGATFLEVKKNWF